MSSKILFNVNTPKCIRLQNILSRRRFASTTTQKDGVTIGDEKSAYETADETPIFAVEETKEDIEKIRNKSRLSTRDRNVLRGQIPYKEPIEWFHNTVKYKKRMLGRYGMEAVGIPAGFAWPSLEEIEDMKEYERVAYPYSLKEEWARIAEKNKNEAEAIKAREADISAKMLQMKKWVNELNARIARKEAEMLEAKKLKERMIEEVRHELGFNVPMYDDKFKEALAAKEKKMKKQLKEMKKKLKEEKGSKAKGSAQIDEDATASSLEEPEK